DKHIIVIPTKTVAQGITAVINFVPDLSVQENEAIMLEETTKVKTGQVTYAVRDTQIDDKEIHQGDFMGIGDTGILAVGRDMEEVTLQMVDEMMDGDKELISIYHGEEISAEQARLLADRIEEKYDTCDVELQYGGQPVYYYIISVE
ncbi:MAG: DAK2 domain-containing protein, partial [Lachnospiraceae bacterium]